MHTLIILHPNNGFTISCHPTYEAAEKLAVDATFNPGVQGVIYNESGKKVWDLVGMRRPAPVATPAPVWTVYDSMSSTAVAEYAAAREAESAARVLAKNHERMHYVKGPSGFVTFEATSQPLPKLNFVVSDFTGATVLCKTENLADAIDQAHAFADSLVEVITVWMNGAETRQVYATTGRFPINESGMYYSRQGMLCNVDGTRSIFDDVDA